MAKYRILVVDDEEDICEILAFNLRNAGYDVDTVNSAEDALFKMKNYFSLPKDLKIRYYVKRVIATEGQTIDFEDGKVLVDGAVLDEPYYDGETTPMDASVDFPMTVEEGHVIVMGDNRPHSKDSRDSSLGAVPEKAVVGKSQFRIWPPKSIGATK